MTPEESRAYLDQRHVANLVTLYTDGSPHVAPVWYLHREGSLYVSAGAWAVKVRNIRRDARVAVSIANASSPAMYVLVEGRATVTTEAADDLRVEMYVRYQGRDRGIVSARERQEDGPSVVIRIEPAKAISWVSGADD